jgi:hypothetical protein
MGLAWLANHGYPNFLPTNAQKEEALQLLVEKLASSEFMNTGFKLGSNSQMIVDGLSKYAKCCGYKVSCAQYAGIHLRQSSASLSSVGDLPDFELLQNALNNDNSLVFLNLGYYKQSGEDWMRFSGHWVLCVGYSSVGIGHILGVAILIHNPALGQLENQVPKGDLDKRLYQDVLMLSSSSGWLRNSKGEIVRSSDGLFAVQGAALPKSKKSDLALLEGVLVVNFSK